MAANPFTAQIGAVRAGTPNARRALRDLYSERLKQLQKDYNYMGSLVGKGYNLEHERVGRFASMADQTAKAAADPLLASGYGSTRSVIGQEAREAVDPYKQYMVGSQNASAQWMKGLQDAEKTGLKELITGLPKERKAAQAELEEGIFDATSNLRMQQGEFSAQQAYNAQLQNYMNAQLGFMAQQGNASAAPGRIFPGGNTAYAQSQADFIKQRWGITVGGYATSGHVKNSDHYYGRALDAMINSGRQGNQIASYYVGQPNVKYVIYNRRIWTPSGGWRAYNGSSPHTDHVHISFYS